MDILIEAAGSVGFLRSRNHLIFIRRDIAVILYYLREIVRKPPYPRNEHVPVLSYIIHILLLIKSILFQEKIACKTGRIYAASLKRIFSSA